MQEGQAMRRAYVAISVVLVLSLSGSSPALAGSMLYVSDTLTDLANIPTVLSGGSGEVAHGTIVGAKFRPAASSNDHDVTIIPFDYTVTGGGPFPTPAEGSNAALAGLMPGVTLSDYDAVYWSASGPHEPDLFGGGLGTDGGHHTDPAVFTSLSSYVAGGGFVFVTGHDALADPTDQLLIDFVGGGTGTAGATQFDPASPMAIAMTETALTIGVMDIQGLIPGSTTAGGFLGSSDLDAVDGLEADTMGLVEQTGSAGEFFWTIRVPTGLGDILDFTKGQIAYVANGVPLIEDLPFDDPPTAPFVSDGEDPSWLTDPAYNAALRNFAFNSTIPEPSTGLLLGMGLLGLVWRRGTT
jgi:hypothetical protein